MSDSPSPYVHGTDPVEQRRLSTLNELLNETSLRQMAPRRGERALDLGAGLAQMTRAIARATGVRVLGIERSVEQIEEALRQARAAGDEPLIELRRGDALDPPLEGAEWGSFDLAHARFILEHVSDPLGVVRQMVRALKPGGRLVLEDDDHDVLRLHPEPPGFDALWRAYMRTYDAAGNDPLIGRKLVQLIHAAGAIPQRNHWLFFGGCAGDERFAPLVENAARILEGARGAIEATRAPAAAEFERTVGALREWAQRPDGAIWFARCWAEGVKPA